MENTSVLERILTSLTEEFKNDNQSIGAVLHGSHAKGQAHSKSDVDIMCVTEENWFSKEIRLMEGIEVEIQRFPLEKLQKDINRKVVFFVRTFSYAKILFDTDGKLESLCKIAKEIYEKGPPDPNTIEVLLGKSFLRHRLEELDRCLEINENNIILQIIEIQTFIAAIEAYHRLRNMWKTKTSIALKGLPERDPEFWRLCHSFFNTEEDKAKVETLKQMVEYALKPVGDLEIEYETPKIPITQGTMLTPIFFH